MPELWGHPAVAKGNRTVELSIVGELCAIYNDNPEMGAATTAGPYDSWEVY
jgi:hypothetical protein